MVTDGSGKLPDRVPTQYDRRGHRGSHCHNGVPLQDSFSGVTTGPICVMFGTILDKLAFCPDCAVAVKKMDLTDGWPA
jgi:type VI secretion system secreted protein VgrG